MRISETVVGDERSSGGATPNQCPVYSRSRLGRSIEVSVRDVIDPPSRGSTKNKVTLGNL